MSKRLVFYSSDYLIESKVFDIATLAAEELGLEVYDIAYKEEGSEYTLCVFIDKEGGVTMDDCEKMAQAISKMLDVMDIIDYEYSLTVCTVLKGDDDDEYSTESDIQRECT